jgi:hypothetical protein
MKHLAALTVLACAMAIVAVGLVAQAQDAALQPVVDRFYPTGRLNPANADERHACYEVLETASSQEPTLVIAAYTDRAAGAIRILRRGAGGEFEVAADSPLTWALSGTDCQIQVQDLDFDGRSEAIVYFLGTRASSGWVVRWDGSALVSLTPTRVVDGRESSLLLSPVVYDLEHKGALRIVAAKVIEQLGPGQQARNPAFVYRLGSSGYEMEEGILGIMGFRADVDPRGNVRVFRFVQDSIPPWRIRVINGDRSGNNRVTGASISINEQEVIGPGDVNERTEFTTKVLQSLTNVNHMTATLTGPGEAYITVLIEDSMKR